MPQDPVFWLVAGFGVLIAGISKAGFGSGAAFAATAILALVVEPGLALGLMLPLLMIVDVAALRAYWGKWDWRVARRVCLGAVPGVALAALVFRLTDPNVFRFLIGAVALTFVAFQFARARGWVTVRPRPYPPAVGVATGGVAGFTSFVSHAGGPPVLVYMLSLGLPKTTFQATTVLIFWVINVLKAVPYLALGFLDAGSAWIVAALAPVALLGAWIGVRANRMVPEKMFFAVTYALLIGAGVKLIADALA